MNQGTRPIFSRPAQGEAPMSETITITAEALAAAIAKANQRENPQAPMVSVFNPRGERDHPRPSFRAKTMLNGIPLDRDTMAWEEIEALNVLPPGTFRVAKANGQKIPFSVPWSRRASPRMWRV